MEKGSVERYRITVFTFDFPKLNYIIEREKTGEIQTGAITYLGYSKRDAATCCKLELTAETIKKGITLNECRYVTARCNHRDKFYGEYR